MSHNQHHDLDILLERLFAALQEAKYYPAVEAEAEALEWRLFLAHDAVTLELANAVSQTGVAEIGYTESVEELDMVYSETVELMRLAVWDRTWGLA